MASVKRKLHQINIGENEYTSTPDSIVRTPKRLVVERINISRRQNTDGRSDQSRRSLYTEDLSSPVEPQSQLNQASQGSELDLGEEWPAKAILEEDETRFRVDWEGVDSEGSPYEPSW